MWSLAKSLFRFRSASGAGRENRSTRNGRLKKRATPAQQWHINETVDPKTSLPSFYWKRSRCREA
jgi:hypothetical protein